MGPLHQDVKDYFGTFWSLYLAGLHRGEPVYLAAFENEQRELETLRGWIETGPGVPLMVAHFGDDRWLGADVITARVSLEDPGRPASPVAESLAEWLDSLHAMPAW